MVRGLGTGQTAKEEESMVCVNCNNVVRKPKLTNRSYKSIVPQWQCQSCNLVGQAVFIEKRGNETLVLIVLVYGKEAYEKDAESSVAMLDDATAANRAANLAGSGPTSQGPPAQHSTAGLSPQSAGRPYVSRFDRR